MWGVLLVPSSSPTLSPIYDGLDVNVTSNVTWFHLNHEMVSRRIYKLSFYGEHSITRSTLLRHGLERPVIYPNLRSFGWVSYDKAVVLYAGKLGNRSEARASDLRSHPGLWWNRIKLRLYGGKESEYSPRTCSIGKPAAGTLCPHL